MISQSVTSCQRSCT